MKKTHIIIHHTASRDDPIAKDWEGLRAYHLAKGWRDIGYNWGGEMVDHLAVIREGRSLDIQGAHCRNHNMNRIGIGFAVIGNFELAPPPPALIDMVADKCVFLCREYGIPAWHIDPHSKYSNTLCPGRLFPMNYLRELVRARLNSYPKEVV
jgi:hypothetical protein